MDDMLETTLQALAGQPDSLGMTKAMAFLLIAGLGLAMALVYIPPRGFPAAPGRSRPLRSRPRAHRRPRGTRPAAPPVSTPGVSRAAGLLLAAGQAATVAEVRCVCLGL